MDGTRELVDVRHVWLALAVFSAAALVLAGVLAIAGRGGSHAARKGALLGGAGVLVFPMWLLYNGIAERFGLDSVAALVINGLLFLGVGVAAGLAIGRLWPAGARAATHAGPGDGEGEGARVGMPQA